MRAREDNRITSGVFDCANKLEQEPESVMLCLLPGGTSDDISVSIQHKLIEAYCWENDINVIKVCTKHLIRKQTTRLKSAIFSETQLKLYYFGNSNTVDPDETAHLDPQCLQIQLLLC